MVVRPLASHTIASYYGLEYLVHDGIFTAKIFIHKDFRKSSATISKDYNRDSYWVDLKSVGLKRVNGRVEYEWVEERFPQYALEVLDRVFGYDQ